MILGIDASNIRAGGGITHLVELLSAANPQEQGIERVIIWGGLETLSKIEARGWLRKMHDPRLDRGLPSRSSWQRLRLKKLAKQASCDVLFVPGGSDASGFRPMVTMSQNLLPFEWRELQRFGYSWTTLRLMLLRSTQSQTFRKADGLIFLTQYARGAVMRVIKTTAGKTTINSHGIDERFVCPPREQLAIEGYSAVQPFRILYVSIIDEYKHQWQVAEAVAQLRDSGLPVALELVGPAYPPALAKLEETLDRVDPARVFLRYVGVVPHEELHARYTEAELCLFASSCENMPNILLEGMVSGLPIACSNRGPMPEVLGDAGRYFDPESPEDIARALQELIQSPELRARLAQASFNRSKVFSWQRCAAETFEFLRHTANAYLAESLPARL